MIEFLSQIDTQVFLFFNSFHTPALDQFMMLLSHRMVWVPMYVMIFAMVVHRYGLPAGIIVALGVALTVTLADQTCATLIRPFVQRLRPANPDNPISDLVHIVWGTGEEATDSRRAMRPTHSPWPPTFHMCSAIAVWP